MSRCMPDDVQHSSGLCRGPSSRLAAGDRGRHGRSRRILGPGRRPQPIPESPVGTSEQKHECAAGAGDGPDRTPSGPVYANPGTRCTLRMLHDVTRTREANGCALKDLHATPPPAFRAPRRRTPSSAQARILTAHAAREETAFESASALNAVETQSVIDFAPPGLHCNPRDQVWPTSKPAASVITAATSWSDGPMRPCWALASNAAC